MAASAWIIPLAALLVLGHARAQTPAGAPVADSGAVPPSPAPAPAPSPAPAAARDTAAGADSTSAAQADSIPQKHLYEYIAHPILQLVTWPIETVLVPVVGGLLYPLKPPLRYFL